MQTFISACGLGPLNVPADNFPYRRPLWSWQVLFGAPAPRLNTQSAAICRTSAVPAANVLNNATECMNLVPRCRVCACSACIRGCDGLLCVTSCLPLRLSPPGMLRWLVRHSYESGKPSQTAAGRTWLCFFPVFPLPLLTGSHTGGIWNLLAAESHRAIKPSKAHKQTRGRALNNVGPTSCQQTQRILNLNKPHCSFFILAVSRCVSLNYSPLSLSCRHHLGI